MHLNEIIYKLIASESPCPALWHSYHQSIINLQQPPPLPAIKTTLRAFERVLFAELGVSIAWQIDNLGQTIQQNDYYDFVPNQGFVKATAGILGGELLKLHQEPHLEQNLTILGQIHRALIDFLLDYQSPNSRIFKI